MHTPASETLTEPLRTVIAYHQRTKHEVFGLNDLQYQDLYHFTVGGSVEDTRLTTLAPYEAEGLRD